jgi:hypothetical protein
MASEGKAHGERGSRAMELSHLPVRTATGAFILNSGLSKRNLEGQAAEQMHGWASSSIPVLARLKPEVFVRLLSGTEVALGTALLVPVVPSALVGLGLVAFSAGLLTLYLKTPGMRQEGSIRPTERGNGLAKDVWLLGAGLTLLLDDITARRSS